MQFGVWGVVIESHGESSAYGESWASHVGAMGSHNSELVMEESWGVVRVSGVMGSHESEPFMSRGESWGAVRSHGESSGVVRRAMGSHGE